LVALGLARLVTLVSVMRIRAAGFEMLWVGSDRVARVHCGQAWSSRRDAQPRHPRCALRRLRVISSPGIEAEVEPCAGEVPASAACVYGFASGAAVLVITACTGLRSRCGVRRACSSALTFANPFGIAVQPRALARALTLRWRSQRDAGRGRPIRPRARRRHETARAA